MAPSAEQISVLVVDDEPSLRDAICEAFVDEGFRTLAAAHGQDAINCLERSGPPDVIVLDLDMPVMNGAEFHAWLKQQTTPLAKVPVVLVSASMRLREVAARLNVEACLQKPVLPDPLVNTVRRVALDGRVRR